MKYYVIDSSVVIKWYIPEIFSEKAVNILYQIQQGRFKLMAPELILSEIGNVLWKKTITNEISFDMAKKIIENIIKTNPVKIVSSKDLISSAFTVAHNTKRTVYDSMYLALALKGRTQLISADERLVNSLKGSPFEENICLLQSFNG